MATIAALRFALAKNECASHIARASALLYSSKTDTGIETIDFGYKQVPLQDKQDLVGKVFSNVASSYDVMNDLMSGGMHRLWKDRLVEAAYPFPGMRHIDVAGGTGDVAFRVLPAIRQAEALAQQRPRDSAFRNVPPGSVTVCDINAEMLEVGKGKAIAKGLAGPGSGLEWVQGDAQALPLPSDTFDVYTIAFGIRNVTDRDAALREALRVLRRGGRALVLEFSPQVAPPLQGLYDAYSFTLIPLLGELIARDRDSYQYLVESIRQFPDKDTFSGMMEAAGFKSVTCESMTAGVVALHSGFKL